jgi:hypothetical protein
MKPARYRVRTSVADSRDPLVSSLFPQFPSSASAREATPVELPPTSRPPVTTLRHEDSRVCACHLELSRLSWCVVASHRRCPPASALVGAASIGFRSRPLDDEAQVASLAKLPLPNACCEGHRLVLPPRAHSRIDRVRVGVPGDQEARGTVPRKDATTIAPRWRTLPPAGREAEDGQKGGGRNGVPERQKGVKGGLWQLRL